MAFRIFFFLLLTTLSISMTSQSFYEVDKNQFIKDGKPHHFLGTNYWYAMHLASDYGDTSRLHRELDFLRDLGVLNLRIMVASEGEIQAPWRVQPALQSTPGQWDETLLVGLDRLLIALKERNMSAVLCLNNFWLWSGGMAQYVQWVQKDSIPTPTPFDGSAYPAYTAYTASFYSNPEALKLYENYLKKIIQRTNSITRTPYSEDPTIFSWQLANEPRGMDNRKNYLRWINQTADLIRSLDSNHLISLGSEGNTSTPGPNGLDMYEDHLSPNIDYCTFHLWIQNWGFFDPTTPRQSLKKSMEFARKYIEDHQEISKRLGKPLVLEEFGISRDNNDHSPSATTRWRDKFYKKIFTICSKSIREGKSLQGLNFWAWAGEGRPRKPKGVWKKGDDLIGDPPHEFQGWYSVYDKDKSTLKIIKKFSKAFNFQP